MDGFMRASDESLRIAYEDRPALFPVLRRSQYPPVIAAGASVRHWPDWLCSSRTPEAGRLFGDQRASWGMSDWTGAGAGALR
jgi:hypothetical protein